MTDTTMQVRYKVEAFNRDGRKIAEEISDLGGPIEIEDVFDTAVTHGIHTYRITVEEVKTDAVHIEAR